MFDTYDKEDLDCLITFYQKQETLFPVRRTANYNQRLELGFLLQRLSIADEEEDS
jgi:hypothetical protein